MCVHTQVSELLCTRVYTSEPVLARQQAVCVWGEEQASDARAPLRLGCAPRSSVGSTGRPGQHRGPAGALGLCGLAGLVTACPSHSAHVEHLRSKEVSTSLFNANQKQVDILLQGAMEITRYNLTRFSLSLFLKCDKLTVKETSMDDLNMNFYPDANNREVHLRLR